MLPRPVVLCILDGVGWGRRDDGDAVFLANTPVLDRLMAECPWMLLKAHGTAVGMPSDADMGNSEVGHNAMGAGRVVDQGAKLVDRAIASGSIWHSEVWRRLVTANTVHLVGLLSDGNVHSHVAHLHAMIARAAQDGVRRLRVHLLTDGRDVEARSALRYLGPLEALLAAQPGDFAIATGGGRMLVTMDRYGADWPMVARGYALMVRAEGERFASASEAVRVLYERQPDKDDQWLPPFVVGDYDGMVGGDAVVLFNFRGDRAIEISRAFDDERFDPFDRGARPQIFYAGMMEYDGDLHIPRHSLVAPPQIDGTVSEALSSAGRTAFAVSETQKFGHVTYFFNGNRSARLPGEEWLEVPSLAGPFDQMPAMSAVPVCDAACAAILSGRFDHVRLNLANGDMVGHTGDLAATVKAVEAVDVCVGRLAEATRAAGGVLLVTADHGNADQKFEVDPKTGRYAVDAAGRRKARTSHSLHPVPLVLFSPDGAWGLQRPLAVPVGPASPVEGQLAQLGGTLLELSGLPVPLGYLPSLVSRSAGH